MNEQIQLVDSKGLKDFDWPENESAKLVKKWWEPLIKEGTQKYIENVHAEPFVVLLENKVLPIVVTTENYTNSWVCSPYAHYISYGQESLNQSKNKIASSILKKMLKAFGLISKFSKMNSIVYVNNWLFSTDLHSEEITVENLKKLVNSLIKKYPYHAIVFRSLNSITNPFLMAALKNSGFSLLASRYVFVSDGKNESIFSTRILKSDLKLYRETKFKIVEEASFDECEKLLDLYHQLYVVNHSTLQPQFNKKYFKHLHKENLLHFFVLKQDDHIKGMAGYYVKDSVMMCPVFGYDKNTSESNEIYRLLNTALILESKKRGCLFNQSAGAAFFKSTRRAQGSLEYLAVYTKHLPKKQKAFWKTLMFIMNKLGPKFMKNY